MARWILLNMRVRMSKRTLTALFLIFFGIPILMYGNLLYIIFIGFLLAAAAWEYTNIFRAAGSRPATWLVVLGVIVINIGRYFHLSIDFPVLTIGVLLLMIYHLVDFERGAEHAGMDFSVSLGALVYIGFVGGYLISLRQLENGGWWVMFALPCVFMTDIGAFLIGSVYGRHHMTPRLSPRKSWEGFAAGVVSAMLMGGILAYAYSTWGPLHISIVTGAAFGLFVGVLTPLGDLGESMLKRQAGLKDSGILFPGHGGAFDRIDSWIWGAVLGFYFVTWFAR